jgi:hypothetical protein
MANIRWTGVSGDWSTQPIAALMPVPGPPDRAVISAADRSATSISETYPPSLNSGVDGAARPSSS